MSTWTEAPTPRTFLATWALALAVCISLLIQAMSAADPALVFATGLTLVGLLVAWPLRRSRATGHLFAAAFLLTIAAPPIAGQTALGVLPIVLVPLWVRATLPSDEAIGWTLAAVVGVTALGIRSWLVPETSAGIALHDYALAALLTGGLGAISIAWDLEAAHMGRELQEALDHLRIHAAREDSLMGERDAAVQASAAKDQFLSMMSFELRTPLNTILGFSEMLAEVLEDLKDPDSAQDARAIRHSSQHLLEVVDNVLELARLDAGLVELRNHPVEPDAILRYAIESAREAQPGAPFEARIEPVGMVLADGQRLGQIISALLKRAAKRSRGAGVHLALRRESTELHITITDAGTNAPAIGTSSGPQAGLELTYADALVRAMGGDLHTSRIPDAGSSVSVRLPLRRAFSTSPKRSSIAVHA